MLHSSQETQKPYRQKSVFSSRFGFRAAVLWGRDTLSQKLCELLNKMRI